MRAELVSQALSGTQMLGSWIALETVPFNEFEQQAFQQGYASWAQRLPPEILEQALTASSTAMLIAGTLSYSGRVYETRQKNKPGRKVPAQQRQATPSSSPPPPVPTPNANGGYPYEFDVRRIPTTHEEE